MIVRTLRFFLIFYVRFVTGGDFYLPLHTERLVCLIMNDTKEYIIDQAYSLFLSRSYEAVSISEISKAIGLTKGALYHHFTNKEELFKAVIDKYVILNDLVLEDHHITLAQLIDYTLNKASEIVNSIFGETPTFIPISYMALIIDAFRHYPGFAEEKQHLLTLEIEKIKLVMEHAIAIGEIRNDINTEIMAANYFSQTIGIAANLLHNNSPKLALDALKDQLGELYKLLKI